MVGGHWEQRVGSRIGARFNRALAAVHGSQRPHHLTKKGAVFFASQKKVTLFTVKWM